jgi:hypothetical protein
MRWPVHVPRALDSGRLYVLDPLWLLDRGQIHLSVTVPGGTILACSILSVLVLQTPHLKPVLKTGFFIDESRLSKGRQGVCNNPGFEVLSFHY